MYMDKQMLYSWVNALRGTLGVEEDSYPVNIVNICKRRSDIAVKQAKFHTPGLRAIAAAAECPDHRHIILLNAKRSDLEQNFDCAHEIVHLFLHAHLGANNFRCFESVTSCQNRFWEWQANEAAAELIIPFMQLLPRVKKAWPSLTGWRDIEQLKLDLADHFQASDGMVFYRLESLKYELHQHMEGVPLQEISVRSNNQQRQAGIRVNSLNTQQKEWFEREMIEEYRVLQGLQEDMPMLLACEEEHLYSEH